MLECPPKWVLLNEIIEEIKIEFNSRLNKSTLPSNDIREIMTPKNSDISEKVKLTEKVDLTGGESEGNVIELVDEDNEIGNKEGKQDDKEARENEKNGEQKRGKSTDSNKDETLKMNQTKAALNSVLLLRKLNSGCVLIIVKDERTASQVRDYLIHGQVT